MKNRIEAALGNEWLEHCENITYPHIHVIDPTRRTYNKQGLTIYSTPPQSIATLLIENPGLDITATFFKPQCFRNEHGYEPENCEGVFYLTHSTNETWILFLEIKDCEYGNISNYFKKAKDQIKRTVQIFRDKRIITENRRVYANISFPRVCKKDYFHHLITNPEKKKFIDDFNISIKGTNRLVIKSYKTIS